MESVEIGENCFTQEIGENGFGEELYYPEKEKQSVDIFQISNCDKLKSIQIGNSSFSYCRRFKLHGLPSLQSIQLGENNFFFTRSFKLIGLIDGLV